MESIAAEISEKDKEAGAWMLRALTAEQKLQTVCTALDVRPPCEDALVVKWRSKAQLSERTVVERNCEIAELKARISDLEATIRILRTEKPV